MARLRIPQNAVDTLIALTIWWAMITFIIIEVSKAIKQEESRQKVHSNLIIK